MSDSPMIPILGFSPPTGTRTQLSEHGPKFMKSLDIPQSWQ
jgi:hypothetical protein